MPSTAKPQRWLAAAFGLLCGHVGNAANDSVLEVELRRDVELLAGAIGARAVRVDDSLERAAVWVGGQLEAAGWRVERQVYAVGGADCANLIVERRGTTRLDEVVVVGAHYDTVPTTPGADDNASGVAAMLALARYFAHPSVVVNRTLRFVAFANEEPAYFQTELMGSRVYARACRRRGDNIVAMVSLESIGYFTDERGSQRYPSFLAGLFRSSRGNFVSVVGNRASSDLVEQFADALRRAGSVPIESAALPESIPGIGWSDHWSFWREGYPAIMVTDTATFRNPHYHCPSDRPDTLNYPTGGRCTSRSA